MRTKGSEASRGRLQSRNRIEHLNVTSREVIHKKIQENGEARASQSGLTAVPKLSTTPVSMVNPGPDKEKSGSLFHIKSARIGNTKGEQYQEQTHRNHINSVHERPKPRRLSELDRKATPPPANRPAKPPSPTIQVDEWTPGPLTQKSTNNRLSNANQAGPFAIPQSPIQRLQNEDDRNNLMEDTYKFPQTPQNKNPAIVDAETVVSQQLNPPPIIPGLSPVNSPHSSTNLQPPQPSAIPTRIEYQQLVGKIKEYEREIEILKLKKKEVNDEKIKDCLSMEVIMMIQHIIQQQQIINQAFSGRGMTLAPNQDIIGTSILQPQAEDSNNPNRGQHHPRVNTSSSNELGRNPHIPNQMMGESSVRLTSREGFTPSANLTLYHRTSQYGQGSEFDESKPKKKKPMTRLNAKRLKDSILGEMVCLTQKFHYEGSIIAVTMSICKDKNDRLSVVFEGKFLEVPGQVCQIQDYEIRTSRLEEVDFLMVMTKLSMMLIDISPYEHLVANHMEYLLEKLLSNFVAIQSEEETKTIQPYLGKRPILLNNTMEIYFRDGKYTADLFFKEIQILYLNFLRHEKGKLEHFRTWVVFDEKTFKSYFVLFNDPINTEQRIELLTQVNEKPDRKKLANKFPVRKLFINRADVTAEESFQVIFNSAVVHLMSLVQSHSSFSMDGSTEVHFSFKILNLFQNYAVIIFENRPKDEVVGVKVIYCFSDLFPQVENLSKKELFFTYDYPYAEFDKFYGINFASLPFEKKKFFLEHLVLTMQLIQLEKELSEESEGLPELKAGQNSSPTQSHNKLNFGLEVAFATPIIKSFKRTFRGNEYRYPIYMSLLYLADIPVGVKIYMMVPGECTVKNIYLCINREEWGQLGDYSAFLQFWESFKGWDFFIKRIAFKTNGEMYLQDVNRLSDPAQAEEPSFDCLERVIHSTLCSTRRSAPPRATNS